MTDLDLSYAAGIIDGEGTIGITELVPSSRTRDNGTSLRKSAQHRIYVAVSMTDAGIPMWLQATFGGSIQHVPARRANHKPSTRWSIGSDGAAAFCRSVSPFLRLKRQQAEIAVEFYRKHLGRGFQGAAGLPQDELALRRAFVSQIHALNRRGA